MSLSSVVDRSIPEPIVRAFTAADLAALPDELPSGPVKYELDNGRLITMPPTEWRHGAAQAALAAEIGIHARLQDRGSAAIGTGVVLWRNPDRVVAPDVLFMKAESLPAVESPEGYLETIPELVVEVRSKNDTDAYLQRKVNDYLHAGVQIVWVADPVAKTIVVHQKDAAPRTLQVGDILTLGEILPEFKLPLAELFAE